MAPLCMLRITTRAGCYRHLIWVALQRSCALGDAGLRAALAYVPYWRWWRDAGIVGIITVMLS